MGIIIRRSNLIILLVSGFFLISFVKSIKAKVFSAFFTQNAFINPASYVPSWGLRLTLCSGMVIFWVGVVRFLQCLVRRFSPDYSPLVILFSCFGWGMLLVFGLEIVKIHQGRTFSAFLLMLPLFIVILWGVRRVMQSGKVPRRESYHGDKPGFNARRTFSWALCGLVVLKFMALFLNLPLYKGAAYGDELANWWISETALASQGFSGFISDPVLQFRHLPGYPLITCTLLAWVPHNFLFYAEPVLPFLFGLALFASLWIHRPRLKLRVSLFLIASLAFSFLTLSHSWIQVMTFELWYSEIMAILMVSSLFVAMDPRLIKRPASRTTEALLLMGLGAILKLGKPPLTLLLVAAVIPVLVLLGCLGIRRGKKKWVLFRGFFLLVGAMAAQALWHANLVKVGRASMFDIDMTALKNMDLSFIPHRILPFIWFDYRQMCISYVIFVVVALLLNPRRYLSTIAASLGLMASILVLYCSVWRETEIQSSGRYLLHGAYGWVFYFLCMNLPLFQKMALRAFKRFFVAV